VDVQIIKLVQLSFFLFSGRLGGGSGLRLTT